MRIKIHKFYFAFIAIVWLQLAPEYIELFIERIKLVNLFFMGLSIGLAAYFVIGDLDKIRPLLFLFSLPSVLYILSTVQNGGNLYLPIILLLKNVLFCLLVDVLSKDAMKINAFLHAVRDISLLYFVINIAVIILFPQGFDTTHSFASYLYGNPNVMIRRVLPGLCCSSLLDVKRGKKLSGITLFFFAGLLLIYATTYFSVTSVIGVLFIWSWVALKDIIKSRMKITRLAYYSVLLFVLLFEINIVISVSGANFDRVLNDFFGKSGNGIVGRRLLWIRASILLMQKPIIGWGYLAGDALFKLIGNSSGAHNYFLDIAYQRGLIGLGAFLIIIIYSLYRVSKIKFMSDTGYILMGYCCMCFLMFLMEPFIGSEPLFIPILYMFLSRGLTETNQYCVTQPQFLDKMQAYSRI